MGIGMINRLFYSERNDGKTRGGREMEVKS